MRPGQGARMRSPAAHCVEDVDGAAIERRGEDVSAPLVDCQAHAIGVG